MQTLSLSELLGSPWAGDESSFLKAILNSLYSRQTPSQPGQMDLAGYLRSQAPNSSTLFSNKLQSDLQNTFLQNQKQPIVASGGTSGTTPAPPVAPPPVFGGGGTYVGGIDTRRTPYTPEEQTILKNAAANGWSR